MHGGREHDLPPVRRVTDARRLVHRQTDVAGLGERRAAACARRSAPARRSRRPRPGPHRTLDGERGVERRRWPLEDGEQVVRARVDLSPAGLAHRGAHRAGGRRRAAARVAVVEAREQLGRALDVGQQEGDVTLRQLPLRLQLGADESDRDDAVLRGRPQQPRPRLVARGLVLEDHLVEAREGVPHVRGVVDRQASPAPRSRCRRTRCPAGWPAVSRRAAPG